MFVHINPELNALGETISTLKFAERVASIELGAARSNKETGEIRELKDEVCDDLYQTIFFIYIGFYKTQINVMSVYYTGFKSQTGIGKKRSRTPTIQSRKLSDHHRVSENKSCFPFPNAQMWYRCEA